MWGAASLQGLAGGQGFGAKFWEFTIQTFGKALGFSPMKVLGVELGLTGSRDMALDCVYRLCEAKIKKP